MIILRRAEFCGGDGVDAYQDCYCYCYCYGEGVWTLLNRQRDMWAEYACDISLSGTLLVGEDGYGCGVIWLMVDLSLYNADHWPNVAPSAGRRVSWSMKEALNRYQSGGYP